MQHSILVANSIIPEVLEVLHLQMILVDHVVQGYPLMKHKITQPSSYIMCMN